MSSKTKQYDIESKAYTTTGTASAYELTIPKLDSLYDELTFVVEFHVENDASATLNINSLGAIAIMTSEGNAVDAGDLKTTGRYTLVYDTASGTIIVTETVDSEVNEIIWNSTRIPIAGTDIQVSSAVNPATFYEDSPRTEDIFTINKAWTYTFRCETSGNWYSYTEVYLRVNWVNVWTIYCDSYSYDPHVPYSVNITVSVWDVLSLSWVYWQNHSVWNIYNAALRCDLTPNIDTSSWITPA